MVVWSSALRRLTLNHGADHTNIIESITSEVLLKEMMPNLHRSIYFVLFIPLGVTAGWGQWNVSEHLQAKAGIPWTSHQFIAELTNNHSHSHSHLWAV